MKKVFALVGIIISSATTVSLHADTTYVSGIIDTNTVWDIMGSPYVAIGNVLVETLITLDTKPVFFLHSCNSSLQF